MSDLGSSVGNTASGRVDAYNTDWQAASQTQSKHWFTTSFHWRKVLESDARSVAASQPGLNSKHWSIRHPLEPSWLELQALVYDIRRWSQPTGSNFKHWFTTFFGANPTRTPSTGLRHPLLLHRLYTTYMTESYTDLPRDCYTGYILHTWLNRTLTFHGTATQVIYYINTWLNHTLTFHGIATQVIYYINVWLNRTLTFHGTATQVIYYIHDWIVHWLSPGSAKKNFFFIKRHSLTRIKLIVLYKHLHAFEEAEP